MQSMACQSFLENVERALSRIGQYGQIELHNKHIHEVAIFPEKAFGLAHYHYEPQGWVIWKPNQPESELENMHMTRQQAIEEFRKILLEAYIQGFRVLLSTCN